MSLVPIQYSLTHLYLIHRTTATPRPQAQPNPAQRQHRTTQQCTALASPQSLALQHKHRCFSHHHATLHATLHARHHPAAARLATRAAPFHPPSRCLVYMHPCMHPPARGCTKYTHLAGARSPVACARARPYPSSQHPKGAPGTSQAPSQHQAVISLRPTFRIPCLVAPPAPGS